MRKVTSEEVMTHAAALLQLAADLGLSCPRLRRDGTVVVHSDEAGYLATTRLSATASELIGTYVRVITDDAPGATDALEM